MELIPLLSCLSLMALFSAVSSEEINEFGNLEADTNLDQLDAQFRQKFFCSLNPHLCPRIKVSSDEAKPIPKVTRPTLEEMKSLIAKARRMRKRADCVSGILGGNCANSKQDKERQLVEQNNGGVIYKNP